MKIINMFVKLCFIGLMIVDHNCLNDPTMNELRQFHLIYWIRQQKLHQDVMSIFCKWLGRWLLSPTRQAENAMWVNGAGLGGEWRPDEIRCKLWEQLCRIFNPTKTQTKRHNCFHFHLFSCRCKHPELETGNHSEFAPSDRNKLPEHVWCFPKINRELEPRSRNHHRHRRAILISLRQYKYLKHEWIIHFNFLLK